jgi:hypothetical protein
MTHNAHALASLFQNGWKEKAEGHTKYFRCDGTSLLRLLRTAYQRVCGTLKVN